MTKAEARTVATQIRKHAENVCSGSALYCEAPIMLLERAANLLEGDTDIHVPDPIDGAGWAEAAFADEPDDPPANWPTHWHWPRKGDGRQAISGKPLPQAGVNGR